jgi:hypothetical protein
MMTRHKLSAAHAEIYLAEWELSLGGPMHQNDRVAAEPLFERAKIALEAGALKVATRLIEQALFSGKSAASRA